MNLLESAPLPAIALVMLAALVLAHEAAFRLSRRARKSARQDETRGYLVSSALALLGLLMAFTFSAAQDRYRARQILVVAEANAIGTSYLRTQLLDAPWRRILGDDILRYAQTRIAFGGAVTEDEIERNADLSGQLQQRIWRDLAPALRTNPVAGLNLALVQTLNETFDLAATRRAAREAHVPLAILRALALCSVTVAVLVGYSEGPGRRDTGMLVGVLLLVTLAFCLILDLDRPQTGSVRVSEAPLVRAVEDIRAIQQPQSTGPAPPSPGGVMQGVD
jgi:hypothetical protein